MLESFDFPPSAFLRGLHDTYLESTNVSVNLPPVYSWPVHFRVGGCTNRVFRCHLLFLLTRFAGFSREERPEGSLPAFAWSDVVGSSTPIHSVTEWHSLSPSSSTRIAVDSPCGLLSHGERYGLIVFRLSIRVGEVLSIRRRSFVHDRKSLSSCTDRIPFWFEPFSIFGSLELTTVRREFTFVDHTTQP
jgi:hypothetical protein